jgi:hypothetical protein
MAGERASAYWAFLWNQKVPQYLSPSSASLRIHKLPGLSDTNIVDTNVAGLLISSIPLSE